MAVAHEHGGKHHGVILNANGQIVAHIWGHVKIADPSFRYVGGGKPAALLTPGVLPVPPSATMKGLGAAEEEMSLF